MSERGQQLHNVLADRESLLSAVDWKVVDTQVRLQQRSRERHTPPISMFRWWARRSHALIGALLEQAHAENERSVISDPFSGGGTVAIEAARLGLPVYAQDLHPWPIAGLRSALTDVDPGELERTSQSLLDHLAPLRTRLYGTACPQHGEDAELLGCFWVRVTDCPACARAVHLFPYAMLSRASRKADETHSWWGCSACGEMTCSRDDVTHRRCTTCERSLPPALHPLLPGREATCPHDGCGHGFAAFAGRQPQWKCVLVQRSCRDDGRRHVHLDRPTAKETARASDRSELTVPAALREEIPHGLETRVLRRRLSHLA